MPKEWKVCLINPPDTVVEDPLWDEPLGLLYLGAVLEYAGIEVNIVDLNFHKDLKTLQSIEADVFGVYCSSSLLESCLKVNEEIKTFHPEALRIVGGPHATCMPQEMANHVDKVIVGEGERAILKIFSDDRSIIQCSPIQDLDTIPFPARHLIPIHEYHRKVGGLPSTGLITSRGCPNRCAFCSKVWGKTVRFRSASNVLDEVRQCVDKYGIKAFSVRDDTFTYNKPRLIKILSGLSDMDVKWRCLTRTDQVDEDILRLMKEAGCDEIVYGIEKGEQAGLDDLQKETTVEQNAKAIDMTKDAGILVKAAFIVGSPGETWDRINAMIRFVEEHMPDRGIVCVFTPFPGSPAWEDPARFNIKFVTRDLSKYQAVGPDMTGKVVVETEEMTTRDITEAHRLVVKRFRELNIL